ncbi:MAG: hypothetical protein P4L45_12960 [Ignavibacteriaceae bacterium]|nr:hypothetical protein [Ignavibacteriaceae bacterium]
MSNDKQIFLKLSVKNKDYELEFNELGEIINIKKTRSFKIGKGDILNLEKLKSLKISKEELESLFPEAYPKSNL